MTSRPISDLDLTEPGFLRDPYASLAALRATAPMVWHERSGMWWATTHAAVSAVLRERALGRLWTNREPVERFEPFNTLHRNQMMENEPPVHTRLRRLVAAAFARGHVERMRPRVHQLAAELLDAVDPAGFDLVADYAEPLPVAVIADMLGVPVADRPLLRDWSQAIVRMYEYDRSAALEEAALAASTEFAAYGVGLCAECGMVSALHATGGGRLVAVVCVDRAGDLLMPCGRCRQLLWENGGATMLLATERGILTMADVLPLAFGADDLSSR